MTRELRYQAVLNQIAADLVAEIQHGDIESAVRSMGMDAPYLVDELLAWASSPWHHMSTANRSSAALLLSHAPRLRQAAAYVSRAA